jgi:hypothetical protein
VHPVHDPWPMAHEIQEDIRATATAAAVPGAGDKDAGCIRLCYSYMLSFNTKNRVNGVNLVLHSDYIDHS